MKFICLMSAGIDSPVASYLISKYGEIVLVHADNYPFIGKDDKDILLELAERLRYVTEKKIRVYILPHGITLSDITEKVRRNLICVMCKRFLLRYGAEIARREGADAIVTGDSLGQVASQTLDNLFVEQYGLKFPVLRPLIGFDKEDIVKIAKGIGTYEISIKSKTTCRAVPKKVATRANLDVVLDYEKRLDIAGITKKVINGIERLDL